VDYAKPHRSNMVTTSATKNRGAMLPQANSQSGPGLRGASGFMQPEDFEPGPQGNTGVNSGDRDQSGCAQARDCPDDSLMWW
jgi:hypothetical protein